MNVCHIINTNGFSCLKSRKFSVNVALFAASFFFHFFSRKFKNDSVENIAITRALTNVPPVCH